MKKIFMFMFAALTLAVIPSCENDDENGDGVENQVEGLALVNGNYVGSIEFGSSKGLATLLSDANVTVKAYNDNTVDISIPSVRSESYSIEDLFFDIVPVTPVEEQLDVWNFSKEVEVVVNGTVMKAKITGKLAPRTNQVIITISISEIGTLNFNGTKL